jgi:hypothetical protein
LRQPLDCYAEQVRQLKLFTVPLRYYIKKPYHANHYLAGLDTTVLVLWLIIVVSHAGI